MKPKQSESLVLTAQEIALIKSFRENFPNSSSRELLADICTCVHRLTVIGGEYHLGGQTSSLEPDDLKMASRIFDWLMPLAVA